VRVGSYAGAVAGPAPPDRELMVELGRRLERSEDIVVATAVRTRGEPPCRPGFKVLLGPGGPLAGTLGCAELDSQALTDTPAVLEAGAPSLRTYHHDLGEVEAWLEPYTGRPVLVVLGATPVAEWLLRWAPDLGWDTVLVEGRPERVSGAVRSAAVRVVASPQDLDLPPRGRILDAVHTDHDAPEVAAHLATLLKAGARFVGVMGSRRHVGHHLEALARAGLGAGELARVQSPVGLDIGARSPAEIALSILSGLVAARSGREGGWLDSSRGGARLAQRSGGGA
jgi:xanthine dehydrogenase accessory factor